MLSTKIVAGATGLFLVVGGSFGAATASADSGDSGSCAVTTGTVTTNQPVNLSEGSGGGTFTGTTIQCTGTSAGDDAGNWTNITANFYETGTGNCAGESGYGNFTGGTAPSTTPASVGDGTVDNGPAVVPVNTADYDNNFTWSRTGTTVTVTGSIDTTNALTGDTEEHPFTADLQFVPNPATQNCAVTSGPGVSTASLDGTATLSPETDPS